MLSAMRAEFVKMRSVKSFYWTSILVILFSVGMGMLSGIGTQMILSSAEPEQRFSIMMTFTVPAILAGFRMLGIMVIMIMACLIVTTEYRFGTIKPTLLITPVRPVVALAKFIVYGLWAVVLTLVTLPVTLLATKAVISDKDLSSAISLTDSSFVRALWTHSIQVLLMVAFAMGISLLVRHTAGAITLTLLYTLAVETMISILPWVSEHVGPYLPLRHIEAFISQQPVPGADWGAWTSLLYAAVWMIVIFAIGLVTFVKRDA